MLGGKVMRWTVRRIYVDHNGFRDTPHQEACPVRRETEIQADGTGMRANSQIEICTEYGAGSARKWTGLLLDCENGYIHGKAQGMPGTYKFEVAASNSGGSSSIVLHINVMDSRAHIISYYEAASGQPDSIGGYFVEWEDDGVE